MKDKEGNSPVGFLIAGWVVLPIYAWLLFSDWGFVAHPVMYLFVFWSIGSTIMGIFVRMSEDWKEIPGWARVLFYVNLAIWCWVIWLAEFS